MGAKVGRVLKPRNVSNGYHGVNLNGEQYLLHRLVWESFNSVIPDGLEINHIDGDKKNNVLSNLEVVTRRENVNHAFENGLVNIPCGENNHKAKLTQKQASEIRKKYSGGSVTQSEIASDYNVDQSVISRIVNKKCYKYVK